MSTTRRLVARALAVTSFVAACGACDQSASESRDRTHRGALAGEGRAVTNPALVAPRTPPAADAVAPAPDAASPIAAASRFVSLGAEVDDDAWSARARRAQPTRVKPVGTSSVVLKTTFVGGLEAAFRPRTHTQPRGWTNELAAYRIARALSMDQVPPVLARAFSRTELQAHLHPDFVGDWPALNDKMAGRADVVWGSLVYWVPGLRDLDLDTPRGMVSWAGWLAHDGGPLSSDETSLAADVGTMLCFDYLVANVDRWSGGNVRADASGRRVIIRDHNLAFVSPLPLAQHERVLGHMRRVERFSRRFIIALHALDEARLRAALTGAPDLPEDTPLLNEAQLRGVLDRREALLSRVAQLIDVYGDAAALAFP